MGKPCIRALRVLNRLCAPVAGFLFGLVVGLITPVFAGHPPVGCPSAHLKRQPPVCLRCRFLAWCCSGSTHLLRLLGAR